MTEDVLKLKQKFALELLRNPKQPFAAGQAVFGMDTGSALRAAQEWINDPDVIAEQRYLLDEMGARHFLPTKEEVARGILDFSDTLAANKAEEKLKAIRLYCEIMGFIEKPSTVVNNNNNVQHNNVMLVKDHGNDHDWQEKLQKQQNQLITDATTVKH